MSVDRDLPLLTWKQECRFIAFPPVHQIGKIRRVARKWLDCSTDKQAAGYARKIEGDMRRQYDRLGIPAEEQDQIIDRFWLSVRAEIKRLEYVERDNAG